jgi:hypothetical protein
MFLQYNFYSNLTLPTHRITIFGDVLRLEIAFYCLMQRLFGVSSNLCSFSQNLVIVINTKRKVEIIIGIIE